MTRVLLLADDPSVAKEAVDRLVEEEGCEVETTSSVADAFERLAKARYDFVVVDRTDDSLAVAKKLEERLVAKPVQPVLLVPTAAAFGLQSILASAARHVRDLVDVIENAIQYQLSAAAPARG